MSNKVIHHNKKIFKIKLPSGINGKIYFDIYNKI